MPTYVFRFKDIKFDTSDPEGDDELTASLLNSKYGRTVLEVEAEGFDEALKIAINQIKWRSGFDVIDADYDLSIT